MFRHARVGEETRRGRCEMGNISLRDRDTVTAAERGREFWRGVLLAGGFTAVPRWTLDPVPGIAEHEAKICNEVVAALRRLAGELAVPLSSVLLTAHAKVLGALSGEREVSTGYSFEGRSPLLCRFTTEPHSWRAMLLKADRAQSELLARKDFPVDDLRREMGLIKPLFETVFSFTPGDGAELAEETVVWVGFAEQDGLVLRLRYRTDVLDADCAARIAGYHVTALALIAADPDAEHARQTLLSAEELHFHLHGRRRVFAHRAAFPGRPYREDALPRGLPARADRTRQHHDTRPGNRFVVRSPDALHRCVVRRGPLRR